MPGLPSPTSKPLTKVPRRPFRRGPTINFWISISYLGFLFAAKAQRERSGNDKLQFRANLGRMPFSAESRHDRANALAIVAAASRSSTVAFGFPINSDHDGSRGILRLSSDAHIADDAGR